MRNDLLLGILFLSSAILFAEMAGFEKRVKITDSKDGKKQRVQTDYYTNSVLVRREVVSVNKESKTPVAGFTHLYQNGGLVLDENWGPGPVRQRTFFRDGHQILSEMDKDGDGFPDWVLVYRDSGKTYAVFKCPERQKIELLGTNAVAEANQGLEQSRGVLEAITNISRQHPAGRN